MVPATCSRQAHSGMMGGMSNQPASLTPGAAALIGVAERDRVLATLRAHEPQLRRRGVGRLRLFGSIARGEAGPTSDVDRIAEIDRGRVARFSLLDLAGLELDLADLLGRVVQIVIAPDAMHPRMRMRVEADAIEVFDGRA